MLVSDIIFNTDIKTDVPCPSVDIKTVSTSPEIEADGVLFVSLGGDLEREKRAALTGASAILCEGEPRQHSVPVLYSGNIRRDYALIAKRLSGFEDGRLRIIGVTGTNGKTTVATLIYKMLNSLGRRCAFIGTGKIETPEKKLSGEFYSMTTPDPNVLYPALKEITDLGCEFLVMEVSSHSLYYDKTAPLSFELSVFTNLSREHMDFHKNTEDYYRAKKKLGALSKKMIINLDDAYGRRLYSELSCEKIGVGALFEGDVRIKNISGGGFSKTEYLYFKDNLVFIAKTSLIGLYNVYNTALALTAVCELGIKPYLARRALLAVESVEGRFEVISEKPRVVIDYAHTSEGISCFLKALRAATGGAKITAVFGAGGERDKEKRPKMAKAAEKYADLIIVTCDNPRGEDKNAIIKDIVKGFGEGALYKVIPDRAEAISYAIREAKESDVVAIIGKGSEGYLVEGGEYRRFSDKSCALSALAGLEVVKEFENQA